MSNLKQKLENSEQKELSDELQLVYHSQAISSF